MSLINDALKKAQRMRAQEQAASAPPFPNDRSGPVAKRARPMSAQRLAGIAAGAALLVAVSVIATVFWLRKPEATPTPKPVVPPVVVSESSPPAPAARPAPSGGPASTSTPATAAPSPLVVVVPPPAVVATVPIAPKAGPHPAATPAPDTTPPPPTETAGTAPAGSSQVSPAVATAIRPSDRPASVAKPDPRAQTFVDALRVAGIRSSGSDSKVLMNDRVFRVNDIVERTLGLRLTGVAPDRLTFTDENGVVYTRNF